MAAENKSDETQLTMFVLFTLLKLGTHDSKKLMRDHLL